MVRSRFTGSGRAQEGGFIGTHKQDFDVHRTGDDWRHDADHINMNPVIGAYPGADVQETLELISAAVGGNQNLSQVLSIGNITAGLDIDITGGSNITTSDGSDITLTTPIGTSSGNLVFSTGDATTNDTGDFDVDLGNNNGVSQAAGGFSVLCGDQTGSGSGNGGGIDLTCGDATGMGTGDGGSFLLFAGDSSGGSGGSITLTTGSTNSSGTESSGGFSVTCGDQTGTGSGDGGGITLTCGSATNALGLGSNNGGSVAITAGSSAGADGGSITLTTGSSTDTLGSAGNFTISTGAAAFTGAGGEFIVRTQGSTSWTINNNGVTLYRQKSDPSTSSIDVNELAVWYDNTNEILKARDSDGNTFDLTW